MAYSAYNLDLSNWNRDDRESFEKRGRESMRAQREATFRSLSKHLDSDGVLDGSAIVEKWFPKIASDVFISHSHADKPLAVAFAAVLNERFGLTSFIDSNVWGHADDLLREIDNRHCLKSNESYSYEKRNGSTSHVHMMLATALSDMIDRSECVLFLNTPNSVTTDGVIARTASPWILHELATLKIARVRPPLRKIEKSDGRPKLANESLGQPPLKVLYNVNISHFATLDVETVNAWVRSTATTKRTGADALDDLYRIRPSNR